MSLAARRWRRFEPVVLSPVEALARLGNGDAALGRLDIRRTFDGVEDGLWALAELGLDGVDVLNPPGALLSAHDKLATARALDRAGLPHPRTEALSAVAPPKLDFPLVLKPRFGSWGRDVVRCDDPVSLRSQTSKLAQRPWFVTHGAIAQQFVPTFGHDLRLVVAGGTVVGAVKRVAAAGEWRTNIALGALRVPVTPPPRACELAIEAADAIGGDLVGVDLLPVGPGNYVVLEINGAVDFSSEYSLETDVFQAAAEALERRVVGDRRLEPIAELSAVSSL